MIALLIFFCIGLPLKKARRYDIFRKHHFFSDADNIDYFECSCFESKLNLKMHLFQPEDVGCRYALPAPPLITPHPPSHTPSTPEAPDCLMFVDLLCTAGQGTQLLLRLGPSTLTCDTAILPRCTLPWCTLSCITVTLSRCWAEWSSVPMPAAWGPGPWY